MSVKILGPLKPGGVRLPFYSFKVPAGFPSPAADHIEKEISLDELLNLRAPHVYLVNIDGDSMEGVGIYDGDIAVVDRSITPEHGHIVIAAINNDPMCKRLNRCGDKIILTSENHRYPARHIMEGDELAIWGTVTFSVRAHERKA
jgi:DNA polymerase V